MAHTLSEQGMAWVEAELAAKRAAQAAAIEAGPRALTRLMDFVESHEAGHGARVAKMLSALQQGGSLEFNLDELRAMRREYAQDFMRVLEWVVLVPEAPATWPDDIKRLLAARN